MALKNCIETPSNSNKYNVLLNFIQRCISLKQADINPT